MVRKSRIPPEKKQNLENFAKGVYYGIFLTINSTSHKMQANASKCKQMPANASKGKQCKQTNNL
ncbi:MAG: hypothetical protein GY820_18355 [Gammaproteobacteria bacterium]|nr:hypothetical protein [Gammaproteobacteria bacterium]